jgi:glycerol-3-phosphate acyltransferase PlsY
VSVGAVVLLVAAYLAGSVPFALLAGRLGGVDLRTAGSGNPGATNVMRVLGRRYGIPVFVLDVLKGAVPAAVGVQVFGPGVGVLAGAAATIGHVLPLFAGFRGGKGVATAAGAALGVAPLLVLAAAVVWIAVLWWTRYVSLASIVAAVVYAASALATGAPWPVAVFAVLAGVGIVVRHRSNLARLRAGTESKTRSFGRGATAER